MKEIKVTSKRVDEIFDKLNDLVLKVQELKLEKGCTQRSVRQWKKDVKSKYAALVTQKGRLVKTLEDKEKQLENERLELKYAKEEQFRRGIQEREKEILEERLLAELRMTERKLEMEKVLKHLMRNYQSL